MDTVVNGLRRMTLQLQIGFKKLLKKNITEIIQFRELQLLSPLQADYVTLNVNDHLYFIFI